MKKTLFLMTFLITSFAFSQEQKEDKLRLGIKIEKTGIRYHPYIIGKYVSPVSPMLTLTKKRHQFEIGPQFYFRQGNYYSRNIGGLLNYKFYPNGYENRFNSFLKVNLPVSYSHTNDPITYAESTVNSRSLFSTGIGLGYGINLNISKRWYIESSASLNFSNILRKEEFVIDGQTKSFQSSSITISPKLGFSIGYRF